MTITKDMKALVAHRETLERRKDRWRVRQMNKFAQPAIIRSMPYRLSKKAIRMQRFHRFGRDMMKSITAAMKKSLKKFDSLIASVKD